MPSRRWQRGRRGQLFAEQKATEQVSDSAVSPAARLSGRAGRVHAGAKSAEGLPRVWSAWVWLFFMLVWSFSFGVWIWCGWFLYLIGWFAFALLWFVCLFVCLVGKVALVGVVALVGRMDSALQLPFCFLLVSL